MQGKKLTLAFTAAIVAALFAGCEWTGSSDEDSWSGSYDAMNFSGTYRTVVSATTYSSETNSTERITITESGGTLKAGTPATLAGSTSYANLVPGSVLVSAVSGSKTYTWQDNGEGSLVFGNTTSGTEGTSGTKDVSGESHGNVVAGNASFNLNHSDIVPGSVVVSFSGTAGSLVDQGDGTLKYSNEGTSGTIDYTSGGITIVSTVGAFAEAQPSIHVSYSYNYTTESSVGLTGSGTIKYPSGAWSIDISTLSSNAKVTVRYTYYLENSTSEETTIANEKVTAITVSQNGQNLTLSLNNGTVMSGKFTNVQQTGKVDQDTSAGYNTYNAQFEVSSAANKCVGSLNYDLTTGYRMLNGTWTSDGNSYDVQAAGPAWVNSADSSTLSSGVITK